MKPEPVTIGIDCGGRKLALVSPQLGWYLAVEVKKQDYELWYRTATEWLYAIKHTLPEFYGQGETHIVMEAAVVAGARNLQSTIRVAQTTGLVHAILEQVSEVAVSSWKKTTVRNGNASKDQVREWLEAEHPDIAKLCRGNQDLIDAACISLHARQQLLG